MTKHKNCEVWDITFKTTYIKVLKQPFIVWKILPEIYVHVLFSFFKIKN
jgi:hypothetical protein